MERKVLDESVYPRELLEKHLWPPMGQLEGRQVYAILDGARNDEIYPAIMDSKVPYCCLYRGKLSPDLAAAAPYLVQLQQQAPLTKCFLEVGWADYWGVVFSSSYGINDLRGHFRRFLMVHDEQGDQLYFRFYDPRVWRLYLPICREDELNYVFGPISAYWIPGAIRKTIQSFALIQPQATRLKKLVMREDQIAILGLSTIEDFEERMIGHLERCFEEECELIGLSATKDLIRFGVDRATRFGIITERDMCKYIDLLFVFGRDLDADPELTWTTPILRNRQLKGPGEKIEALYEQAIPKAHLGRGVSHHVRPY